MGSLLAAHATRKARVPSPKGAACRGGQVRTAIPSCQFLSRPRTRPTIDEAGEFRGDDEGGVSGEIELVRSQLFTARYPLVTAVCE